MLHVAQCKGPFDDDDTDRKRTGAPITEARHDCGLSTEIEQTTDGGVVRNGSHPDPSDHEYLVTVDDGVPATCECPDDERCDGACKHRVAVRSFSQDSAKSAVLLSLSGSTSISRQVTQRSAHFSNRPN